MNFFIYRQLDALISRIHSGMKLYMFWAVHLSIIRSLFAVHSVMVYVIQVCRQLSSRDGIWAQPPGTLTACPGL